MPNFIVSTIICYLFYFASQFLFLSHPIVCVCVYLWKWCCNIISDQTRMWWLSKTCRLDSLFIVFYFDFAFCQEIYNNNDDGYDDYNKRVVFFKYYYLSLATAQMPILYITNIIYFFALIQCVCKWYGIWNCGLSYSFVFSM